MSSKPSPIGIDFGSDCLRLAQVRKENGQLRLVAAGLREVPPAARETWATRLEFFVQGVKEILSEGTFTKRQVILGLPAAGTYVAHLRLPKMDPKAMEESLQWEVQGKLPIDPSHAMLRHIIAGEVFVDQEARDEIIVMASRREMVSGLVAAAEKAGLDILGVNVEMTAIVECFSQVYRRKGDAEAINCFLDIGSAGSRVIVSCGRQILFIRAIPVGASHLNSAIAAELNISKAEAGLRRRRLAEKAVSELALTAVETRSPVAVALADDRRRDLREIESDDAEEEIARASAGTVETIVEELTLCRRYYESTFPGKVIDRLIFIGGGAADRRLCQEIARGIAMPAQVGDPLVRVEGREIVDQGIKRPRPAWAVAVGLSCGGIP